MGISIKLNVSDDLTQEVWEKAYEESLVLINQFPLFERVRKDYFGQKLYCAVRTKEHETWRGLGWCADGDYETLRGAEEYFLPRKLPDRVQREEYNDALMSMAPVYLNYEWDDERCKKYHGFWGNKTQGEPYHMYLLAIACVFEDRLGEKAVVYGDITKGQCRKAVELANRYLEHPINLPVRCDMQRFYERLRKLPLEEHEVLGFFENCYLGVKDKEFGEFIRAKFTKDEIEAYWKKVFKESTIKTIGFSEDVHRYLTLGFELEGLCGYVSYVDGNGNESYEYFVQMIMDTAMYEKEKDCRDCLKINPESEQLYGVSTLMAQLFFAGAHNNKVDRYMPLEEIEAILEKCIGHKCDVGGLILKHLAEEEQRKKEIEAGDCSKEKSHVQLEKLLETISEQKQQEIEKYDITCYDNLVWYEPGDSITPGLSEAMLKSYEFYCTMTEEDMFRELMEKEAEDRCEFLVGQNRNLLLREEDWQSIFEDIKQNKESFYRYYPMIRIRIDSENLQGLTRAFVLNNDIWKYCKSI